MPLDTNCARCGRAFTASSADVKAGRWRVCPRCRDGPRSCPRCGSPVAATACPGCGTVLVVVTAAGPPPRGPTETTP